MGRFIIEGSSIPVSGEVKIGGAKNAVLPIMAACVMCGSAVLHSCPPLLDTRAAADILGCLGVKCRFENKSAFIEYPGGGSFEISRELCGKMRSSVLFLAPAAARYGRAEIYLPGGCCLGKRPVDMHLKALETLGAKISCENDRICLEAENGFEGGDIYFDTSSVGATETAITAAVTARGRTRIHNPAREPEIADLCAFLNKAGADIEMGEVIEIQGRGGLLGHAEHTVMPDRIEAGTYLILAAATGGELFLKNAVGGHISPLCEILRGMGCIVEERSKALYIDAPRRFEVPPEIVSAPYPAFPTDLQPQMTALLAKGSGLCMVRETVFEGRYRHIPQLNKMGADIAVIDNTDFAVNGRGKNYHAAEVTASDLRCGAALVIAAAAAKGESTIHNAEYVLRGYEDICKKMSLIGVKMRYRA